MQPTHAPLPGTWVLNAQAALDDLARLGTFDEVAANYPNPRVICEAILGYPVAGGSATKRAIRAVGVLLRHPIGPAVAVEALSWAASVSEVLDSTSIETFLEQADDATVALRPLHLDERHDMVAALSGLKTPRQRRETLARWWERREPAYEPYVRPEWDEVLFYTPEVDDQEDPAALLAGLEGLYEPTPVDPFASFPLADRIARETTGARQLALYKAADEVEKTELASDPRLFGFKPAVVACCVLEHTATVLRNPACPAGLVERVRYPYDAATLELALRAGRSFYDPGRVSAMLTNRDAPHVVDLAARLPVQVCAALTESGALTAADLTAGLFRHVDLSDRHAIVTAAQRAAWDHRTRTFVVPDWLITVLREDPTGSRWLWLLDRFDEAGTSHALWRRLADAVDPAVRLQAVEVLGPGEVSDAASLIADVGGWRAAQFPQVPARERPQGAPICLGGTGDDRTTTRVFAYPAEIESLTSARFDNAPGWAITLPRTSVDLERNARIMRNCTAGYTSKIAQGDTVILLVNDLAGKRYNVELRRSGSTWTVAQINNWANGGDEPGWLRPALTRWFTDQLWSGFDWVEPSHRCRRDRPRK